jgi:hemerythrin superfamily protein
MRSQSRSTLTSARRSRPRRNGAATDAITLLRADHRKVQDLFGKFEKARKADQKGKLARQICAELKVHTRIEEEILYPAARDVLRDEALVDEATVEHASAKALIAQIELGRPGDGLFDARVTVLGEYIKHHIKEEHGEFFPKLRKTRLDLRGLGRALLERKEALKASA